MENTHHASVKNVSDTQTRRELQTAEPKRIIMIRHTKAEHNKHGWLIGQADTSLTPEGRQQAERVAQLLKQEPFVLIVSSDMERAKHVATIVRRDRNVPIHTTKLARERHYEALEETPMTPEEFFGSEFAENLKRLLATEIVPEDPHIELVPGWETDAKLAERLDFVISTIEQFLLPGQTALLVSHAHVMRAWLELVGKLELNGSGSIPHESGVVIEVTGGTRRVASMFGGIELRQEQGSGDDFNRITSRYMKVK